MYKDVYYVFHAVIQFTQYTFIHCVSRYSGFHLGMEKQRKGKKTYICISVCVDICLQVCAYTHISIYIYVYIHIDTHMHTYVCIAMFMNVCK
jgi:hypothetical protein